MFNENTITYYEVIQLTQANSRPCEQVCVRYGDNIVVLRNFNDALTFLYCEKFFLKYVSKWDIDDVDRIENIYQRKKEIEKIIHEMQLELKRDDYRYIEKLLYDFAEESMWVFNMNIYDKILRLDARSVL